MEMYFGRELTKISNSFQGLSILIESEREKLSFPLNLIKPIERYLIKVQKLISWLDFGYHFHCGAPIFFPLSG